MDVSVASYYNERKINKGSQMGHTKKIFKKKKKNLVGGNVLILEMNNLIR
jgi:hypothetical protein